MDTDKHGYEENVTMLAFEVRDLLLSVPICVYLWANFSGQRALMTSDAGMPVR